MSRIPCPNDFIFIDELKMNEQRTSCHLICMKLSTMNATTSRDNTNGLNKYTREKNKYSKILISRKNETLFTQCKQSKENCGKFEQKLCKNRNLSRFYERTLCITIFEFIVYNFYNTLNFNYLRNFFIVINLSTSGHRHSF